MYKQMSSGRMNRSRGYKVKNVLQICVLLAVCFWLIYQVKQSHEKKDQFGGNESSLSQKTGDGVPNLGRKDLHDSKEIGDNSDEKRGTELEDNNPEEDEQEQENNNSEEKNDGEVEREDEEKDSGEGQDGNSEDNENDEDSGDKHEAQEVLYKADDASSAVTHDTNENNVTLGGEIAEEGSKVANTTSEELSDDSALVVNNNNTLSDTNLTASKNEGADSSVESNHTESSLIEGHPRFTTQDDRWSSTTDTSYATDDAEKSGTVEETGSTNEAFESFNNENVGGIEDLIDSSDSSLSLDEKEARTDVETLPEIQTEGSNTEDAAAK